MPNSCTAREILVHDSVRLFGLDAQGSASWLVARERVGVARGPRPAHLLYLRVLLVTDV